ncbi:hypothetical protein HYR69_08085 [Candidatus Sumerlaeota bacterium]|nr:hypothetical protein [Candidatus Sumerlaeota bacterium]
MTCEFSNFLRLNIPKSLRPPGILAYFPLESFLQIPYKFNILNGGTILPTLPEETKKEIRAENLRADRGCVDPEPRFGGIGGCLAAGDLQRQYGAPAGQKNTRLGEIGSGGKGHG